MRASEIFREIFFGLSALSYRPPKEYCEPAEFQPIAATASE